MINVRVALSDSRSGYTYVMRTPRDGSFAFDFVPPGDYTLLAEQLGYRPVEVQGVQVYTGGETEVHVALSPVEPPVIERTVQEAGEGLGAATAGAGWTFGPLELRGLPDERSDLASALRFSSMTDDALVIDGLPASHSLITVDGIPFQFAQHPLLGEQRPADHAFPISALAQATVDSRGSDIEWTDFTSGRVSALGLRGSNHLEPRLYVSSQSIRGGVLLSGPVIKDTAHFVLGVDVQRLQQSVPPAWEPNGADSALLVATDSLGVDLSPYRSERKAPVRVASGFGRFDWQASNKNRMSFLAFGSRLEADDPVLGYGRSTAIGSQETDWELGLGATLTNIISASFALELRAGFETSTHEYKESGVPLTRLVDGPAAWGTDPAIPGRFQRSGFHATEAAHLRLGVHRLKIGGGANFSSFRAIYEYGRSGTFVFGGPDDLLAGDGAYRQLDGPEPFAKFKIYEFGGFLQDRWRVAPGAEFQIGLRLDIEHVDRGALIRNQDLVDLAGIVTDSIDPSVMKVSPRVGLVWDVGDMHRWVVRADGGVYHGSAPQAAFAEAVAGSGQQELRYATGALGSWPDSPPAAASQGMAVAVLPNGFSSPRSTKAGIGVSGAIGGGLVFRLSGGYRHTSFLTRRADLNRVPGQSGRDQDGRPLYGTLEQHGSALFATPGSGRRIDGFSVISALNQDGVSNYVGVTAQLERRLSQGVSLSLGYTYSHTTDNVLGMAGGPDEQLSPFPDGLNGLDWADGVSDFDVPHRLVAGLELTFRVFRLTAFYGFRSGRPFTPGFRDGVDANGDGSWRNDPAFINAAVDGVTPLFSQWDCLRTQAGRFAARNSCRGPTLQTLDLRLIVGPFRLMYPVELVVDGMNLLETEFADIDRALYLVDPTGTLETDPATGVVTVPLVGNPGFGTVTRRFGPGRYLRVGLRVNYE